MIKESKMCRRIVNLRLNRRVFDLEMGEQVQNNLIFLQFGNFNVSRTIIDYKIGIYGNEFFTNALNIANYRCQNTNINAIGELNLQAEMHRMLVNMSALVTSLLQ